jgi:hypothetical protein
LKDAVGVSDKLSLEKELKRYRKKTLRGSGYDVLQQNKVVTTTKPDILNVKCQKGYFIVLGLAKECWR